MGLLSNKRGFNGDVSLLMVVMFLLAITVVAGGEIFDRVNTSFGGSSLSQDAQEQFDVLESRYSQVWDGAFVMVFSLFALALVLSTASLGSRPEFFFITVFVGLFFVGAAAILSNIFAGFVSAFSTGGQWTFIPLFLNNLVEATLLLLAMLVVGLFVKVRSG